MQFLDKLHPCCIFLKVLSGLSDVLKLLCFRESDLVGEYFVEGLFATLGRGVFVGSHSSYDMDGHTFGEFVEIGSVLAVP